MVERKTIKPEADLYERLNGERKERRLSWDEYLKQLLDNRDRPSEPRIETGDGRELERINERVGNIPERTADLIEERLR